VILFFFGLVNAGVPLTGIGVGTWVVLIALLGGKPIGILLFTGGAAWAGLHRPPGVTWRDMVVVGIAAAIGFTVSLFFATAAFPSGRFLAETKMGALLSLFSAAGLAIAVARAFEVGRFARARDRITG
jgi:NhaA family Na+:H+ antiporter